MRGRSILLGLATIVLACAGAASASPASTSADDNYLGAYMTAGRPGVVERGAGVHANGAPFMLQNNGQPVTFIIGCEDRCSSIRLRVRAAGQPDFNVHNRNDDSHSLTVTLPQAFVRSLSNFEVDIDTDCGGGDECVSRWATVSAGPQASLASRGLPAAPTEAEWNAGVPSANAGALQWVARPDGENLRFYYPVNAWRQNRNGSARLQCLVTPTGTLRCRTSEEAPANAGFGEAARRMATAFRVAPTDANGQPTANRRVVVPVEFAQSH